MAKGSKGSGQTSSSTTQPQTNGKVVKLEPGKEKDYLCSHICFAKKILLKEKLVSF